MRFAMMARIFDMGTSSPGSGCAAAGFAPAEAGAAGGADGAGAAGLVPCSRWPTMSDFVIRPEAPVPGIWERSTLLSFAILRTSGEERTRSPSEAATGAGAAGADGAGAAAGAAFAGAGAAGFPAAPPMTATMVLI